MTRPTPLHVAIASRASPAGDASPEHRRFKTLLDRIEKAKSRLHDWQVEGSRFAQMHRERALPLQQDIRQEKRAWAFELEQAILSRRWSSDDRLTLHEILSGLAGELLDGMEAEDAELRALFDRWSDISYEAEKQLELDRMKQVLKIFGNVDLGDAPLQSMAELLQQARAQVFEQRARAKAIEDGEEVGRGPSHARSGSAKRQASRAASKAQKRAEEEQARVSQAVRNVYRKLAAALHPDRTAPDAADVERRRRTDLMAKANAAYEADDLLTLLTLQLQIEQVDIAHAATIAAAEVKHFNRVLSEQLRNLEQDIEQRQMAFCQSFGLIAGRKLNPKKMDDILHDLLLHLSDVRRELQLQRLSLRTDIATARRYLKQYRVQQAYS